MLAYCRGRQRYSNRWLCHISCARCREEHCSTSGWLKWRWGWRGRWSRHRVRLDITLKRWQARSFAPWGMDEGDSKPGDEVALAGEVRFRTRPAVCAGGRDSWVQRRLCQKKEEVGEWDGPYWPSTTKGRQQQKASVNSASNCSMRSCLELQSALKHGVAMSHSWQRSVKVAH